MENENEEAKRIMLIKRMILRKGMTAEARERLARVRIANPELAEKAENVCVQIIQQGKKVDDEMLKRILARLSEKREIRIMRW